MMAISPAAHTADVMKMMRFISPNPFSPVWLLVTAAQSKLNQQSYVINHNHK